MNKKEKKAVPVLRFPEFEGDWVEKSLREITDKISDGIHSTPEYDDNGEYYFINGNNLVDTKVEFFENTKKINELEYLKYAFELTYQTILLSINGTIGNIAFYRGEKIILGKSACYLNLRASENKFFVFCLLQASTIQRNFEREVTGTTIKNLSLATIKQTKTFFPDSQEQQKIAQFLSACDEKLKKLRCKREYLETYKRGVMQQIFTQKIRFHDDDGSDFPDWEEKKLGDVAIVNPSSDYFPEQFLYIDLECVKDGILGNMEMLDKEQSPSRAQRVLKNGDILYQTVRPYQKNNLFFELEGDYVASTGYAQLRAKQDKKFLYYSVYEEGFVNEVLSRCTGTSYPAINSNDLKKIAISFPSIKEQQKIAQFLTAIDRKIEAVTQQINRMEQFKKGLLQKMFV